MLVRGSNSRVILGHIRNAIEENRRNGIEQAIEKVQDNYKIFADFLAMIVKVNAEQRMTTGQCWASLRPYSEKILEL